VMSSVPTAFRNLGSRLLSALDDAVREPLRSRTRLSRIAGQFTTSAIEIVQSVLALLYVTPAIIILCILLLLYDSWPRFYRPGRIGRGGKPFFCLKFRTMRRDADQILQHVLATDPVALQEWRSQQKLRSDPRVHPLGRFLRMTSLDEIPQFINVLRG